MDVLIMVLMAISTCAEVGDVIIEVSLGVVIGLLIKATGKVWADSFAVLELTMSAS